MDKKTTYDSIKLKIEKEGYILVSKVYINNRTKMSLICQAGHEYMACWDKWKQGRRCPHCARNIKPTHDFVKKEFEKEGYILLSNEYINAHQKLDYICPKGHKHSMTWVGFRTGSRCIYCSSRAPVYYENVKEKFESKGYILLSTEYKNNKQKLTYKCSNGHIHTMSYNELTNGTSCPSCKGKINLTHAFIKEQFEKENYTLLSNEFVDIKRKLKYRCPKNHIYSVSWRGWKRGHRCPYCSGRLIYSTYQLVELELKNEGYTLLSNEYKNSYTKLKYRCPKGHEHSISWYNWNVNGQRCASCSGNQKKTIDEIKKLFSNEGYVLLSKEYKSSRVPLSYKCPYGHIHSILWSNWKIGSRCPSCAIINNSGENHHSWRGSGKVAWYDTYIDRLAFAEEARRSQDNKDILEVKCTYCGSWFKPTRTEVNSRYRALYGSITGERRFYCSEGCKKACPIFNQKEFPRGFKPATSREVQPQLRQMVLERDGWACLVCGKTQQEAELHCHHITGVVQNPIESADIDNCITLCKKHHKEIHKQKGCNYNDLKCKEKFDAQPI